MNRTARADAMGISSNAAHLSHPSCSATETKILFRLHSELSPTYIVNAVANVIDEHKLVRVCEIGAGRHPLLPLHEARSRGVAYTILDISQEELEGLPYGFARILGDICDRTVGVSGSYDYVFSKMVLEHVADSERFHANIFRLLAPGGFACHVFPTLYATPFLMNRLLPERAAVAVLSAVFPDEEPYRGKFPAYYRGCRGPTKTQIRRLQRIGYEVLEYTGFFGHGYYSRIPGLGVAVDRSAHFLTRRPIAALTSYALVLLRKPLIDHIPCPDR